MLKCEKCGSTYFIEKEIAQFSDVVMGAGMGYRALAETWKVYECWNSECGTVIIPPLTSMSAPKSDVDDQAAIISTYEGKPVEVKEEAARMPRPGEMVRR